MVTVDDTRKVVAASELLAGEILGTYPALRHGSIGDLLDVPSYGPYEDYDIPRLIEPETGEACNCVLEEQDNDCVICVMSSINNYVTNNDDQFQ